MKTETFTLRSPFDNLELSVAIIEPDTHPKAVVQFSHGMAEHKERYFPFMEYLAKNGYACVIHDHRGHGGSVKSKEDLGYFYTEDIKAIVGDLHELIRWAKKNYPGIPIYLFGHSMGTLVARNYMQKYDAELDKVVLSGPPTENYMVGIGLLLAKLSRPFYKQTEPNYFLNRIATGSFNKNFKRKNEWLSRNPDNVAAYNADELCGFTFTTNGFINLFKLQKGAFNKRWKAINSELPICVMAGAEDPVIGNESKFRQLVLFLAHRGYKNIKCQWYPKNRHEILNEANAEAVYQDIVLFLEKNKTKNKKESNKI